MKRDLPNDLLLSVDAKKASDHSFDGQFSLAFSESCAEHSLEIKKPLPKVDVKGQIFYALDGLLNIHSMQGIIGPGKVEGDLSLDLANFKIQKGRFNVHITDCSPLTRLISCPLEGEITAEGAILGTLIRPNINLIIKGNNLKIYQEAIDNLSGEMALSKSSNGLDGHAFVSFDLRGIRFKSDHIFQWTEKQISLTNIHADYGNVIVAGGMSYLVDNKIFEGGLEATLDDSGMRSLYDVNMQGSAALSLKFYGISSSEDICPKQNMEFSIQADRARYENFQAEKATVSGLIRNVFNNPIAYMTLSTKHALYKGWRVKELIAETTIDPSMNFWPFKVETMESFENDLSITSSGQWKWEQNEFNIHLKQLQGYIKKHFFELQDPVTLSMQKDVFDLSPFSLTLGKGSLYTTIDYKSDQAHTTTRLDHVPLEIFYPPKFITPFTGTLSGEAYLFGRPGELTGKVQAHLSHIKILDEAFEQTSPFEVFVDGTIAQTHMTCSAQIIGITEKPIEIMAGLPIAASLNPPNIYVDEFAPFYAKVEAQGEIAPLLQLLVIETSSLSGKTHVSLDISGSFSDPHVSGNITIAEGIFESPNTGAVFHHLNASVEAHDKILVLKEFKALDLSDGIIQGVGSLELKRELGFPFTLELQLSKIRLLNLDFVKAIASGEVVITGNSRMGKIQGHLTTDSVQTTIPEQSSALAHAIDVKYINVPKGEVSPVFTTSRPRWPLELDLQIDVEKNATIKAKDLSSYWHGGVKVQGMAHAPLFFGDFKIIKGEYHFNGQTFDIKEGTISFAGESDKKTTLYVIASKDLGKIVAEVILKGPVKNPLIAFRSNPPMSQREILSWILFGRGSTDITPFQGSELSQSISDLAKARKKEPDMLTKIRDKIGIDRIDISKTEGNESNEVSLQVGKYISRGVFVKLNKSITSEANQVGIEANLWPNIKAEAQVGDDSSTQLQLKWKQDY